MSSINQPTPANVTVWIAVITFLCQAMPPAFAGANLFTEHTIKIVSFVFDMFNILAAAAAIFFGVNKTK